MKDCIFCKIINKEIPTEFVFEDEDLVVFNDIKPMAPIHLLFVPRKHIVSIAHLEDGDRELISKMIFKAGEIARDLNISEKGYKLMFHVGKHGGQEVPHLHLHLLGGAKMKQKIEIVEK
ncbi:MAG: histidine triad nucleotide-binding protein [Candidatus Moraniibacteriota bacterium]